MKRILIKFYQSHYDEELKFANMDLAKYNNLLNVIKSNIPNFKIDIEEITKLLNNPHEYAFDAVVGDNQLKLAGVTLNKKKAMEFVDLPNEWLNVIKEANKLNKDFSENTVHKYGIRHADSGTLDRLTLSELQIKKNEFVLSAEYLSDLKQQHSLYTKNAKQNTAHEHFSNIHNSLKELQSIGVSFNDELSLYDLGFKIVGGSGEPYSIDFEPSIIRQY
jgi:hypothetical protein